MKIGFLFNHYAAHQVLHAAPIAFELSRRYPRISVQIIGSDQHALDVVNRLSVRFPGEVCERVLAHVPALVDMIDPLVKQFAFIRKAAVLRFNLDLFRKLDVLVVPEITSLHLKRDPRMAHLKFVHTRHGAGDRAGAYWPELAECELILVEGRKTRDRLIQMRLTDEHRCRIVGYPKFELQESLSNGAGLFDNRRPTVLYNPHFARGVSSWVRMGKGVLDFFRENADYNLIFAPHVILYQRKWRHGARSLRKYRNASNIHIDTGSLASIDMTYTAAADIYLGDASSQVYEFLLRPRPCIFLNAHHVVAWQQDENFRFWHAGQVINEVGMLSEALSRAEQSHPQYLEKQKELLRETFDFDESPPSVRASIAIARHFGFAGA